MMTPCCCCAQLGLPHQLRAASHHHHHHHQHQHQVAVTTTHHLSPNTIHSIQWPSAFGSTSIWHESSASTALASLSYECYHPTTQATTIRNRRGWSMPPPPPPPPQARRNGGTGRIPRRSVIMSVQLVQKCSQPVATLRVIFALILAGGIISVLSWLQDQVFKARQPATAVSCGIPFLMNGF